VHNSYNYFSDILATSTLLSVASDRITAAYFTPRQLANGTKLYVVLQYYQPESSPSNFEIT
jgi:hypothetical protein